MYSTSTTTIIKFYRHFLIIINILYVLTVYTIYVDYRSRITKSDYVNMFNVLYVYTYLSDRLLVLAYICCIVSVIRISAKPCITAPLIFIICMYTCIYIYMYMLM